MKVYDDKYDATSHLSDQEMILKHNITDSAGSSFRD